MVIKEEKETHCFMSSLQLPISCEPWLTKNGPGCRLGYPNWHSAKREGSGDQRETNYKFSKLPHGCQQEVNERQLCVVWWLYLGASLRENPAPRVFY